MFGFQRYNSSKGCWTELDAVFTKVDIFNQSLWAAGTFPLHFQTVCGGEEKGKEGKYSVFVSRLSMHLFRQCCQLLRLIKAWLMNRAVEVDKKIEEEKRNGGNTFRGFFNGKPLHTYMVMVCFCLNSSWLRPVSWQDEKKNAQLYHWASPKVLLICSERIKEKSELGAKLFNQKMWMKELLLRRVLFGMFFKRSDQSRLFGMSKAY